MAQHQLDRTEARRIAVRAQLLTAGRPADLLSTVKHLTLLQVDPTAAIAPAADLVAWTRLGSAYRPADLSRALEHDRTLFELDAMIRPMDDLPLFLASMADVPHSARGREWLAANDRFRTDILDRLRAEGPLKSRDIPDTSQVSWQSTGWSNNRNVTQMLELLLRRGEIAISRRDGRERFWDLAERVYPADVVPLPPDEARRIRNSRRLAALGIARASATEQAIEQVYVEDAGEEAVVDGVKGTWRVDPTLLGQPFEGRTALLSPFDRLSYDRARAGHLFEFDYQLEMYKPEGKRKWGYFALPILHDDRLVGKVDAVVDRKGKKLTVRAIHEDVPFDTDTAAAVQAELDDLAAWLGVERHNP
ncbi:crosslink repair DNA glycosylase YcaQ family protein [Cryobacterium sp. BB307]|uniref:DNA glycosylase AlkZ-like family protein n=1 Tax=Cryobacterium sp. BB307 TaxID=2716317 RepID=UPI0014452234|nr:crosslink repair DNA glycosylase YcaQ family protein [Cryobacterium sp. BB307]